MTPEPTTRSLEQLIRQRASRHLHTGDYGRAQSLIAALQRAQFYERRGEPVERRRELLRAWEGGKE